MNIEKTFSSFILLLILFLTACEESATPDLRIAHISWPGYEALSLADNRNLYKNINVRIYRPSNIPEAMLAFENNIVDVLAVAINDAILIQSREKEPLVIFCVLDVSHGGDVIIANQGIQSIKDLKGKRMGMEPSALGAYFLSRALDSSPEINMNQIHIIPAAIDQHDDLFISKKIDAVTSYGPVTENMIKAGGHVIFDSSKIPNEIIDVLITRKSFAEQNPDALTELINGYYSALSLIENEPESSINEISGYEGMTPEQYKKMLQGIHIPQRDENRALLSDNGKGLQKNINQLRQFLINQKIISGNHREKIQISNEFITPQNN